MVCLGERDKLLAKSSMAVTPERTTRTTTAAPAAKPLHNFDLPWLRWGSHRYLRCMKVNNSGAGASHRRSEGFGLGGSPIAAPREARKRKNHRGGGDEEEEEADGEGIAAVREKLLGDLKVAAAKMKDAIFRDGAAAEEDDEEEEEDDEYVGGDEEVAAAAPTAAVAEEVGEVRPWNLRTRRAACKAPAADGKVTSSSCSPEKTTKPKREKFSLGLTRKEIEADFMAFLGQKPARRPKKRPRVVQRQLDFLLPGFLLGEITTDTYKVSENPETGKR